jgi:galactose mutarotase-like enzyme
MTFNLLSIASPNGATRATFIPEKGGLGTSLVMPDPARKGEGRELLYLPKDIDLSTYPKLGVAWPFCFPICGRLNRAGQSVYLHEHRQYPLSIHGFAHALPWEVLLHSEDTLTMALKANKTTHEVYPFEFEVVLSYTLKDGEMQCHQTTINHGHEAMPYYSGFHPYFWIDPARYQKSEVLIDFTPLKRLKYNADLTDVVGEQPCFGTPIALLEPAVNESLSLLGPDRAVKLYFPDHSTLEMSVQGMDDSSMYRYLQLYHVPEQPFFCIEPWMGHPNAMNTPTAVRLLPPGQRDHAVLTVKLY